MRWAKRHKIATNLKLKAQKTKMLFKRTFTGSQDQKEGKEVNSAKNDILEIIYETSNESLDSQ